METHREGVFSRYQQKYGAKLLKCWQQHMAEKSVRSKDHKLDLLLRSNFVLYLCASIDVRV